MLHLFDQYPSLFQSWEVTRYEQEGAAYSMSRLFCRMLPYVLFFFPC
jgi:hypothetical protein